MTPQRATLKALKLETNRRFIAPNPHPPSDRGWVSLGAIPKRAGYYNQCELCGAFGFNLRFDLHEVIVTRADVRGNKALGEMITEAEENTLLVCQHCNSGVANRAEGHRDFLVGKLVEQYGFAKVYNWVAGLPMKNKQEYLERVQAHNCSKT